MTNTTSIQNQQTIFDSLAQCANCGNPMNKEGANYTCPTWANNPNPCPTPPIEAQQLLQIYFTQFIKSFVNEECIQDLIKNIEKLVEKKTQQTQEDLERTERTIAELKDNQEKLIQQVQNEAEAHPDGAEEIDQVKMTIVSLHRQAELSRRNLRLYPLLNNEKKIKANALEINTYVETKEPALLKELVDIMTKNVKVATDRIIINYRNHDPEGSQEDERYSVSIPRQPEKAEA